MKLEALNVGDSVLYTPDSHYGFWERVTVQRKTATQVVLSNGQRINKFGTLIGRDSWSRAYVREFDLAVFEKSERLRLRKVLADWLKAFPWHAALWSD